MKLNSKVHGLIDYIFVILLLSSPTLFGLPMMTSNFIYALGIIHLLLTVITNFEFGLIKVVPFKIHGVIELLVAILLFPIAFYMGNMEGELSRNFIMGVGVAVFLTWLISDYKKNTTAT